MIYTVRLGISDPCVISVIALPRKRTDSEKLALKNMTFKGQSVHFISYILFRYTYSYGGRNAQSYVKHSLLYFLKGFLFVLK